jgi:hypothetical protein
MVTMGGYGKMQYMDTCFYKGDQNMLWDALPYGFALQRMGVNTTFFVVDEKLGTADNRKKNENNDFMLTSDYCNKKSGAVWVHQDVSSGPFYSTPVEPKTWKRLGVHLKYFDDKYLDVIEQFDLSKILASLGVKIKNTDFVQALTESEEYLGIVPTRFSQRSISSVPLSPELLDKYWQLFLASFKGAMRVTPKHRRKPILERARKLLFSFKSFIKDNGNKSVSDLQEFFWKQGWKVLFDQEAPPITRVSELFKISKSQMPHKVFLIALQNPVEFSESYNEALNLAKLPLKRIRFQNNSMELPFFVECKLECGTLVRWRILAIFSEDGIKLRLIYPIKGLTKEITVPPNPTLEDVESSLLTICSDITLIGKAGPLVTELTRPPRVLALLELGSKYSPMVFHLTRELQKRGIAIQPGKILRLGIHALSALDMLGDIQINLPPFLSCFWGKSVSARRIAGDWWRCSLRAKELIQCMKYHPGQLLTLAKYAIMEYHKKIPAPLPNKLAKLGDVCGISRPMNDDISNKLEELLSKRENLLSERRTKKDKFEKLDELHRVNRAIELVMTGILKRHIQLSQLAHMDRRPFALSFYLAWGSDVISHMANLAHQRREQC